MAAAAVSGTQSPERRECAMLEMAPVASGMAADPMPPTTKIPESSFQRSAIASSSG
jgi:hypothetical protein